MTDILRQLQKENEIRLKKGGNTAPAEKQVLKSSQEISEEANYSKNKTQIDYKVSQFLRYAEEVAILTAHLAVKLEKPYFLKILYYEHIQSKSFSGFSSLRNRRLTMTFQGELVTVTFYENANTDSRNDDRTGKLNININQVSEELFSKWLGWAIYRDVPPVKLSSIKTRRYRKIIIGFLIVLAVIVVIVLHEQKYFEF